MKTRNILFAIALMGNVATAMAQDVVILHMKDGTTRRYTNGVKETTEICFYEFAPDNTVIPTMNTQHDNGYEVEWNVNGVWNDKGQYTVGIYWKDNVPDNFKARRGVLMGTEKGLSIDKHDHIAYYEDERMRYNYYTTSRLSLDEGGRYMIIGQRRNIYEWTIREGENSYNYHWRLLTIPDTTRNIIETNLEQGHTYYYRTFAEGQVEEGGTIKPLVFYGDECTIRIPHVMADNNYYSYPKGTNEAVADFATNFPDSVTVGESKVGITPPTWPQMESLWNIWRATDEGKRIDLSADITTAQFDDGTGFRLNRIPKEFYTWMTHREVVIDAVDGLADISKIETSYYGDSVYTAIADTIFDVDAKWGVPGGKYIRFTPNMNYATVRPEVTYRSNEAVPGVLYRLQANFAPETKYENTDSTADLFLPTRIRVTATSGNRNKQLFNTSAAEIPATEVTTLNEDYCPSAMGLSLSYNPNVPMSYIYRGTHNKIMRIAEIKLTPIMPTE